MLHSAYVSALILALSAFLGPAGLADDATSEAPSPEPSPPHQDVAPQGDGGFYHGGAPVEAPDPADSSPSQEPAPPEGDGPQSGGAPTEAPDPALISPRQEPAPLGRGGFYRGGVHDEGDVRSGLGGSRWFGPRDVPAGPSRRPNRGPSYYRDDDHRDRWDREDDRDVAVRVGPYASYGPAYYPYGYRTIIDRPYYAPRHHFGLSVGFGYRPHFRLGWGLSLGWCR